MMPFFIPVPESKGDNILLMMNKSVNVTAMSDKENNHNAPDNYFKKNVVEEKGNDKNQDYGD